MTEQQPDKFVNEHPRLIGLEYRGYNAYYVERPRETTSWLDNNTGCYRGFRATFRLNNDGTFEHVNNLYSVNDEGWSRPDGGEDLPFLDQLVESTGALKRRVQAIQNGVIEGDFHVAFTAFHASNSVNCVHVSVPFFDGVVSEDFDHWEITDAFYSRDDLDQILGSCNSGDANNV